MPLVRVRGKDIEYEQSGRGPDLLLVHSLLTDASVFERVAPALSRDHRVTCINLPGFGASSAAELASVADYADHVAAIMDALALPKTTHVFGNGFGAFVALELAIRHGDRLAAKAPFRGMAAKVREGGMAAVLDTAIGRMFPPQFQARFPDVVKKRKECLAKVDAGGFARACLALADLDLRPLLATIRNPTLVMCGALDQTTPPALAREVAQAIPGASYEEIGGSGHCPMLEQPESLVASMGVFLGKCRAETRS